MIAIVVIALLLFGPKKLPELGRLLGRGLREFRRAKAELQSTFETHLHELEREVREQENSTAVTKTEYSSSTSPYMFDDLPYRGSYGSGGSEPIAELPGPHEPPIDAAPAVAELPAPETVARSNGSRAIEPSPPAPETEPSRLT